MNKITSFLNFPADDCKSICRSCLSSPETLRDLFCLGLEEAFEHCTSLKVYQDDCLPSMLCVRCVSLLNQFYAFRHQCLKSDALLRRVKQEGKSFSDIKNSFNFTSFKDEGSPAVTSLLNHKNSDDNELFMKSEYDGFESDRTITAELNCELQETPFKDERETFCDQFDDAEDSNLTLSDLKQSLQLVAPSTDIENITKKIKAKCKQKTLPKIHKFKRDVKITLNNTKSGCVRQRHKRKGAGLFKCKICSKTYNQRNLLQKHSYKEHPPEKNFRCEKCAKGFITFTSLQIHLVSHNIDKQFQCDHCQKYFRSKFGIQGHMRIHNNFYKKRFMCTVCGKLLFSKKELMVHTRSHSDDRPLECSLCSKTFKNASNLTSHKLTHKADRPFKCDICSKGFKTKGDCKKHAIIHSKAPKTCL